MLKKIATHIANILYSNTIWIFVSAILTMSIVVIVDGIHQEAPNWSTYFYTASAIGLLFSPVLIFSWFRKRLQKIGSRFTFRSIWVFVFIIYPIIISATGVAHYFINPNWRGLFILIVAAFLFLVELGIILSSRIDDKSISLDWLKRLNLEKTILLGLIPFSLILVEMSTGARAEIDTHTMPISLLKFIYYAIQFYLILMVYYGFYLLNHYILINKLFKEKGIIYYIFGFAASLIILYPISAQLIAWLPIVQQFNVHPVAFLGVFDTINFSIPTLVMLISIPFILSFQWLKLNNEIIRLEKQKSDAELSLLKQQINPHFFFNTLNNLYALSLTKDEKTPEVIWQLSELMRYVIYKGKEESVSLAEEVKYIEDYIELQEIRLHKKLDYRIVKNIADDSINIPPLLFIILVENAFKHGIEPAEKDCFLHIQIDSSEESLVFTCTNSVEAPSEEPPGIGLKNLQQRLNLRYPDRHELLITDSKNSFKTVLKIV